MKSRLLLSIAVLVAGVSAAAIAQSQQDHQEHHPGGPAPQSQSAPPPAPSAPSAQTPPLSTPPHAPMDMGQMMQRMPEQCRGMMQNMPQSCMSMMHQMMQGRTGMMPGMQGAPGNQTAANKAYMDAAERMHGPMMAGIQASDPDVAFVQGMIAHHQGAIDMAKVVLQHGKDDQAKKWANDVLREQQREIIAMQEWLKQRPR